MSFEVIVEQAGVAFPCAGEETVLEAMASRGRAGVQVGCRNGGCGVCRVQVLDGEFETGLMSSEQISVTDRASGIALACRLFPRANLRLRALGRANCASEDPAAALVRQLIRSAMRSQTAAAGAA